MDDDNHTDDSPPDRSFPAINTNMHPHAVPIHPPVQVHDLHSENVARLDEHTTAEEVVRAIKRAQNLHDLHDVKEIARFLVDEVGKSEHACMTTTFCILVLINPHSINIQISHSNIPCMALTHIFT